MALSTTDIEHTLKNVHGFLGVFAIDQLDNIKSLKKGSSAVINLEHIYQSGSHWVCFYIDKKQKVAYYFDSFGLPPPSRVVSLFHKHGIAYSYNSAHLQQNESSSCGMFCIYFIRELSSGRSIYDVLYSLPSPVAPSKSNERFIKNYYNAI